MKVNSVSTSTSARRDTSTITSAVCRQKHATPRREQDTIISHQTPQLQHQRRGETTPSINTSPSTGNPRQNH